MEEKEIQALLEREREQYLRTETLVRSLLSRPKPTKAEIDAHMAACKQYLDEGNAYDGEYTPFVIGFKEGQ